MKILFIVTTRYHMGCALDIFACLKQRAYCDVAAIGVALKKDQTFVSESAKYMGGEVVLSTEENGRLNKFRDLMFLFYRLFFNLEKNRYDQIVVFSPSLISARYRLENPNATVYLGEDGTGSYSGLILNRFAYFDYSLQRKTLAAKLFKCVFRSKVFLNPSGIYVYQPEAINFDYPFVVKKISRKSETNELIRKSMDEIGIDSRCTRAVFIGQHYQELGINSTNMGEIFEANRIFANNFSYRKHPRDEWTPENIELNNAKDWEVLCETVSEDSVFISLGSTALQSPKYLYDKEPYIILTYKMHPEISYGFIQSFELLGQTLKKLYRNNHKVIVPENMDEYSLILDQIKYER